MNIQEVSVTALDGKVYVVGGSTSQTRAGGEHRAFIYAGGGLRDLNELVRGAAGWLLIEARDINDWGQIVGAGVVNGQTRAFLLTPVSTPSQTIEELAAALTRLDIPEPYAGRLRFRLTQAHAALSRATPRAGLAAASALDEFVTLLSAHAGREMSEAQAGPLITVAHGLRSALSPADGTQTSIRSRYSRPSPTQSGHAATAVSGYPNMASAGTKKR